ncbi:MAG: hypothetical protein HRU11_03510 [Parvularculaceae bacterium]|nr:hypothetical protein [Parvularculaceae bacterium]
MSRWLIYPSLIVSGALALFFSLLVGTSDAGNLWDHIALFSSLVTVPLIVFASCLHPLLKGWDVIWDGEGVTGPTKTYTFRPGRTQATLSWSDVKTYGRANNRKGFLIEGHNGVVIHWSELYAGSALPIEAVRLYARHRRSAHRH